MSLSGSQLLSYLYYRKLPQVYRDMDSSMVTQPFYRYLSSLVEGGYSTVLAEVENLLDLIDPEVCPEEFLPYLSQSFGLDYFEDISPVYHRRFLSNIGEIIKRRGTYSCLRFLVRALTGLNVSFEYIRGEYKGVQGRHLIVNLLAETLEQLNDIDTSIFVVEQFLTTQIPYYITPHVVSQVVTEPLKFDIYRGNALVSAKYYNLIPEGVIIQNGGELNGSVES